MSNYDVDVACLFAIWVMLRISGYGTGLLVCWMDAGYHRYRIILCFYFSTEYLSIGRFMYV